MLSRCLPSSANLESITVADLVWDGDESGALTRQLPDVGAAAPGCADSVAFRPPGVRRVRRNLQLNRALERHGAALHKFGGDVAACFRRARDVLSTRPVRA